MTDNTRKEWIDALRALALLFVMVGHLIPNVDSFFIFTSPIKIPLFFAISGYLFNVRNGEQRFFFRNLLFKIIIPWLILAGSIYMVISFVKGYRYFYRSVYGILTGDILWFMPCFIIGKVIFFYCQKFSTKNVFYFYLVLSCILGFIFARKNILNIFMINRALIAQLFFLIGTLVRVYERFFLERIFVTIASLVYLILCFFCYVFFPNVRMDVHLNQYYNEIYTVILVFTGCVAIFGIIKRINYFPKFYLNIGKNTLLIYILHSYVYSAFNFLQKFLLGTIHKNTLIVLTYVILTCAICLLISSFLDRYVPFVLGHSKRTDGKFIR